MAEIKQSKIDVRAALGRRLVGFRESVCKEYAARAEETAKKDAAWEDRTGAARKMLKGYVIDDGKSLGFGLAHRVEYGKHLERDGDGEYAILYPTIEKLRDSFLEKFKEAFR